MSSFQPIGPSTAGNTARNALPSESFGKAAATWWLLPYFAPIRSHIGLKASARCSAPRKYITVFLGLSVGFCGLPPRLMYQDSHGTFEQISGVPSASAWDATALTVSGVEDANSRSTPSRMAVLARSPARVSLDWVS